MISIIGGAYRGRHLSTPGGLRTRPTSSRLREALFNICQNRIENTVFLDLFAGSGAMGFEALSRGARFVVFVDTSEAAVRCIRENARKLNAEDRCRIEFGDALKFIERSKESTAGFDIVYADPPYRQSETKSDEAFGIRLIETVDAGQILNPGGILFVEENHRYPPEVSNLRTLYLKKSRRAGSTVLQQYERIADRETVSEKGIDNERLPISNES